MAEDYGPFLRNGRKISSDGNDRHEGLSVVVGLYGGVRVPKTVELFLHGGNGGVDVVCGGTVCLASDNGGYVN
jgi:hypothetical protein